MAASSPGRGLLSTSPVNATPSATKAFSCGQLQQASFFLRGDGAAGYSYTLQATNMPDQSSEQGPPFRNDAVASPDWATLQTGSVTAGTPSAIVTVNYTPYRALRLILSSTGTTIVNVYAFGTGAAS